MKGDRLPSSPVPGPQSRTLSFFAVFLHVVPQPALGSGPDFLQTLLHTSPGEILPKLPRGSSSLRGRAHLHHSPWGIGGWCLFLRILRLYGIFRKGCEQTDVPRPEHSALRHRCCYQQCADQGQPLLVLMSGRNMMMPHSQRTAAVPETLEEARCLHLFENY